MSRIETSPAANAPRAKNSREGDTLVVGFASRNAVVLFGMPVSQVEYAVRVAWVPTLLSIFRRICDNRIMHVRRIVDGQSFCRPKQKNARKRRRGTYKTTKPRSAWSHLNFTKEGRHHFSIEVTFLSCAHESASFASRRNDYCGQVSTRRRFHGRVLMMRTLMLVLVFLLGWGALTTNAAKKTNRSKTSSLCNASLRKALL